MESYKAIPCPCGHSLCRRWLVTPCADLKGVSFTEEQAKAVAKLLNEMDHQAERAVESIQTAERAGEESSCSEATDA